MDKSLFIGIAVILLAVGFTAFLTFYSNYIINTISDKKLRNLREIIKELHHGRQNG